DRCVGGLASARRQHALGGERSVYIVWIGLVAHKKHLAAGAAVPALGRSGIGVEYHLSYRGSRRGRQSRRERRQTGKDGRVDSRVEQLIYVRARHTIDRFLLGDQTLFHHLDRDVYG